MGGCELRSQRPSIVVAGVWWLPEALMLSSRWNKEPIYPKPDRPHIGAKPHIELLPFLAAPGANLQNDMKCWRFAGQRATVMLGVQGCGEFETLASLENTAELRFP